MSRGASWQRNGLEGYNGQGRADKPKGEIRREAEDEEDEEKLAGEQ